jgi:hypothetical protein
MTGRLEFSRYFKAIHARHHDVKENKIGRSATPGDFKAFPPRGGFNDSMAEGSEHRFQKTQIALLVIDDKNCTNSHGPPLSLCGEESSESFD